MSIDDPLSTQTPDLLANKKLVTARIGLLLKAPFFGHMATRLILQNADKWLSTAATDGRNFYYNSEFINKLSVREAEFLFGHEVLHNIYEHMERRGNRDPKLFNIAADYCVNADLVEQRIGEKITTVPILLKSEYKGMSAEEVYEELIKGLPSVNITALTNQVLDEHLDNHTDGDRGDESTQRGRAVHSEQDRKQIRDEVRAAVINAAQLSGAGSLPAGVKRLLRDLTEPKINWRDLLQQQMESILKADYTWSLPSRRSWHLDAILPSQTYEKTIDVCIAVDVSGSISEKACNAFFSEIVGIMEMYSDYRIHIWTFDTEVFNSKVITHDNVDEMLSYKIGGGGGTDFQVNWEFMRENDIIPKKFIMFTDGYPNGSWGDPDYADTIFIMHGTTSITPPFGTWAYFSE